MLDGVSDESKIYFTSFMTDPWHPIKTIIVLFFQYHSKIHRLLLKYNCMSNGNNLDKKAQDKGMDGCAKSQSFYSGMNHVAINNVSTTTTTTAATASPADSSRVRNSKPTFYYNCCQQLQAVSCSTSPSASVASTVSLCPSHLLPHEPSHIVQLHPSRLPHLSLQHWVPAREVPTSLPPLPCPYIYSSAYEFEPSQAVSPTSSSDLSVEHIYSQIPSPGPCPKFQLNSPQQGN